MPAQQPNGITIAMHLRSALIKVTDPLVGQTLSKLRHESMLVYHPCLSGLWCALGFLQVKKNSWILVVVEGPFYSADAAVAYTSAVKRIEWLIVGVSHSGGEC